VAINDHYFIFMPFAIEKRNSFSALSCKIKLPVGLTNSGAEQTRPSNAPICSRPEQEQRTNRKNFASPFAKLFASHHLNDKVVACSFEGKKKNIILFKKPGVQNYKMNLDHHDPRPLPDIPSSLRFLTLDGKISSSVLRSRFIKFIMQADFLLRFLFFPYFSHSLSVCLSVSVVCRRS
jgi:hypothetical protein